MYKETKCKNAIRHVPWRKLTLPANLVNLSPTYFAFVLSQEWSVPLSSCQTRRETFQPIKNHDLKNDSFGEGADTPVKLRIQPRFNLREKKRTAAHFTPETFSSNFIYWNRPNRTILQLVRSPRRNDKQKTQTVSVWQNVWLYDNKFEIRTVVHAHARSFSELKPVAINGGNGALNGTKARAVGCWTIGEKTGWSSLQWFPWPLVIGVATLFGYFPYIFPLLVTL